MQLQPIWLDRATDIRYEFQLETTGKNRFHYTLIAKFIGTYRPGSEGSPDAHFICGIAQTAVSMWGPGGLILDLREISYVWGDEMYMVLDGDSWAHIPTAVVGSSACLPAIGTLLYGIDSKQPATDTGNIFESVEAAWEYVRKKSNT